MHSLLMKIQTFFAYDPQDTDEIRVDKFAIFLVATICWLAAFIWTAMYYYFFGFSLTTLLPFLFIIIVGSSLLISHLTRNHRFVIYAQIICIIYITALIQWSIGGVFDSGLVMVWAFLGPIGGVLGYFVGSAFDSVDMKATTGRQGTTQGDFLMSLLQVALLKHQ